MPENRPAGRGPTTIEKIAALRELAGELGVASRKELAERWNVSPESVRQLMAAADAPAPLYDGRGMKLWILPEAENYRSIRLRRAGNRGGKHA